MYFGLLENPEGAMDRDGAVIEEAPRSDEPARAWTEQERSSLWHRTAVYGGLREDDVLTVRWDAGEKDRVAAVLGSALAGLFLLAMLVPVAVAIRLIVGADITVFGVINGAFRLVYLFAFASLLGAWVLPLGRWLVRMIRRRSGAS